MCYILIMKKNNMWPDFHQHVLLPLMDTSLSWMLELEYEVDYVVNICVYANVMPRNPKHWIMMH